LGFRKGFTTTFQNSCFPCKILPALNSHIHVGRVNFNRYAFTTCHFGCYNSGTASRKRVVNVFPDFTVIFDRSFHALNRFLSAMACIVILPFRNLPDGGLGSIPIIVSGCPFSHCVPARFMVNVIIPPADNKLIFYPDNMISSYEITRFQRS